MVLKKIRPAWLQKLIYYTLWIAAGLIVGWLISSDFGDIKVVVDLPSFSRGTPQVQLSLRDILIFAIFALIVMWALNVASARHWNTKGGQLLDQRRYHEALASFDRALKFWPKYPGPWLNKGVVFVKIKRYDEALAAYNRALQLNPIDSLNSLIWNNKADLFCAHLHRYDEAVTICDEAIGRGISTAGIWAIKGEALQALGREAEARSAYEQVLTFHTDDFLTWASRAQALAALGRSDEALAPYERAIALHPEDRRLWKEKAAVLRALGREEEAREAERQAEELEP